MVRFVQPVLPLTHISLHSLHEKSWQFHHADGKILSSSKLSCFHRAHAFHVHDTFLARRACILSCPTRSFCSNLLALDNRHHLSVIFWTLEKRPRNVFASGQMLFIEVFSCLTIRNTACRDDYAHHGTNSIICKLVSIHNASLSDV